MQSHSAMKLTQSRATLKKKRQYCTILIFAREDQEFQEKPEAFVLSCRTYEHPRIESFESLTPPGAGALTSRGKRVALERWRWTSWNLRWRTSAWDGVVSQSRTARCIIGTRPANSPGGNHRPTRPPMGVVGRVSDTECVRAAVRSKHASGRRRSARGAGVAGVARNTVRSASTRGCARAAARSRQPSGRRRSARGAGAVSVANRTARSASTRGCARAVARSMQASGRRPSARSAGAVDAARFTAR